MRKRVPRLVVGSTHTLLKPVTVYTVVELRRAPNKRGTTSTTPVWRGACRDCGGEFMHPCSKAPKTRRCERCRGAIAGYTEISSDIPIDEHEREEAGTPMLAANAHRGVQIVHSRQSVTTTKPLFTDR